MACGGFTCSKNALIALNIMYIVVGFILITVAAYGQTSNLVASVSIIGGIIACGVFLILVAILGTLGAVRHHQVLLFFIMRTMRELVPPKFLYACFADAMKREFYMVLLFLIFLIQFSIACACLAMNTDQQRRITKTGWRNANDNLKNRVQEYYGCCSYDFASRNETNSSVPMSHPSCANVTACCTDIPAATCCTSNVLASDCKCSPCEDPLQDAVHAGLQGSGGIGLFFSFTEFIGVWLTVRYRNQKDPRANPRDFI